MSNGELTGQDRLLLAQITASLKAESQYIQQFDEDDTAGINKVRAERAGCWPKWRKILVGAFGGADTPEGYSAERVKTTSDLCRADRI